MGGLLVEQLASGGLGAGQIAWLTTRRILISFSVVLNNMGDALASGNTMPFLNARWYF